MANLRQSKISAALFRQNFTEILLQEPPNLMSTPEYVIELCRESHAQTTQKKREKKYGNLLKNSQKNF